MPSIAAKIVNQVSKAINAKPAEEEGRKEPYFGHDRRALTFDFYGTLLNYQLIPHFVGQVGRENNINPELTERFFAMYLERMMYALSYMSYRDVLENAMKYLDMEFNTKVFSANVDELYLLHYDIKPHPDVLPALHNLKDKGYELYLMANSSLSLVEKQFEHLDGLFNDKNIIVADEVRCYKPHLEFFKAAVDKFKLRTADHFHVSADYFQDIIPATRLHWLTAYVNRSKTGVFKGMEPSGIVTNLSELEEGMVNAKKRIEEEERAARERELAAKKSESDAQLAAARQAEAEKAAQEAARKKAMEQQQQMQAQQAQQQQQMLRERQRLQAMGMGDMINDSIDFGGTNSYFVPQNQEDRILVEKMRNMNPNKARALAKARERALRNRF